MPASGRSPRIAIGAFCVWLVLLPVPLGAARTWALALVLPPLFVIAAAVSWTRRSPSEGPLAFVLRLPGLLFAAFLLCVSLQLLPWSGAPHSSVPYRTSLYLLLAFACATVSWLTTAIVRSDEDLRWIVFALIGGGLLQSVLGTGLLAYGQAVSVFDSELDGAAGVATGTFMNRNHLAGYLNIALSAGCGFLVGHLAPPRSGRRWSLLLRDWIEVLLGGKARLRLMLVMMVIVLIATRSRMGNAAFFAALVSATCIYAVFERERRRSLLLFAASVVALDVLLVGAWVGVDRVMERIGNTPIVEHTLEGHAGATDADITQPRKDSRTEQSVEDRIEPARDALSIIREHPWLGTGGGTFYVVYMAYQPNWDGFYNHAHNDYIEIAADTGLIGLGLLLAIAAHAFWSAIRLIRDRSHPMLRSVGFAGVMSLVAMALHATVDFNLHIPATALTFCVVLALPSAANRLQARELSASRRVLASSSPRPLLSEGG